MRCDGTDIELNKIMEDAHGMLQFIVDMVTNDSVLYMAIGDGLLEPEDVNESEEEENDGSKEETNESKDEEKAATMKEKKDGEDNEDKD